MAIRLREGGRPADSDGTVHAFLVNGGPQSFNEYFLLSFRPDPAPTTIDPPEAPERAFVRAAASAVEEAAAISRDVSLSLVDVGDVVGLERHRGPKDRAVGRFSDRVADRLRQESIREDGVSCVRPGRYSLLHDREVDLDRMQNDLEGYARAVDPDGQSLAVDLRSIALDRDGLDAESVESALTHAVDTFAESGLDAVIFDTLADGEADRLARMRSRLETLETALEQARVECAYRPVCTVADWSVHHLVAEARAVLDDDEMHAGEILRTTADDPALRARVDAALCRRVLTDPSLAARSIAVEVALPSMLDREIVGMLTDLARRSDGRGMILQIAGLEERGSTGWRRCAARGSPSPSTATRSAAPRPIACAPCRRTTSSWIRPSCSTRTACAGAFRGSTHSPGAVGRPASASYSTAWPRCGPPGCCPVSPALSSPAPISAHRSMRPKEPVSRADTAAYRRFAAQVDKLSDP